MFFGIGYSELLLIGVIALVVIGPKDLPRVMREVGRWVGRAQGMARHFRAGIDNMIREAELEEMEKKWREENEKIMRDHPLAAPNAEEMLGLSGPVPSPPLLPAPEPDWMSAAPPPAGEAPAAAPRAEPPSAPHAEPPPPPAAAAPAPDPHAPELPFAAPHAPRAGGKADLP